MVRLAPSFEGNHGLSAVCVALRGLQTTNFRGDNVIRPGMTALWRRASPLQGWYRDTGLTGLTSVKASVYVGTLHRTTE
jgi:hypothetical protein